MKNDSMLDVTGLRVAYGGIEAVKSITFHVNSGELVALIGANGAGKTSTLKAIARMHAAHGSVRIGLGDHKTDLMKLAAHDVVRHGLALVPEGRGTFPRLTIAENLAMGAFCRNDKADIARDMEQMYDHFPRLKEREKQLAGTMSGGEQQMLAIARALMSRPKVLLLDEPSMGLAPIMVQKIFDVVKTVSRQGMTILLVEQNAKLALEIAQRAYVMESGAITHHGDASDLLHDPKVRAAYLGEG